MIRPLEKEPNRGLRVSQAQDFKPIHIFWGLRRFARLFKLGLANLASSMGAPIGNPISALLQASCDFGAISKSQACEIEDSWGLGLFKSGFVGMWLLKFFGTRSGVKAKLSCSCAPATPVGVEEPTDQEA